MITRRLLLGALASAPLAACQNQLAQPLPAPADDDSAWYIGAMEDKPFNVPLVDRSRMRPELNRQTVAYTGSEKPGTIVVDIDQRFLYLVQEGGAGVALRRRRRPAGLLLARHRLCGPQGRVAGLVADHHDGQPEARSCRASARPGSTTRSAPAPSTSTRTATTSCSASTAPTSRGASASRSPPAASAC